MARALIQINGSDSRFATVTIGTTVQLANNDEGGESTYAWSIVDQPEGTADNLSSASIENPTFVPTKEGSYQVRLIVNASLPTQDLQTAIVAVLDARTAQRYPAATESDEASTARGWSQALNRVLKQAMVTASDANLVVAQTPGSIAAGAIVKFSALGTISSGTQAQFDSLKIAAVNGTVTVDDRVGIVLDGVTPGDLGAAKLAVVRLFGLVPFSVAGSPALGDPVFLSDAGIASITPGTVPRKIGVVVAVGGGNFRWAIDGAPAGGLTDGDHGDITVSGGGNTLTIEDDAVTTARIADEAVTNDKLAQMPAFTVKANVTGALADPIDATVAQVLLILGVGFGQFGTGADGDAVFDGVSAVIGYSGPTANVYTATRTAQFDNVTVSSGVTVRQHSVPGPAIRGTLTGPGTISTDGASATGQAGASAPSVVGPLPVGLAGGSGGAANTVGQTASASGQAPQSMSAAAAIGGVGNAPPTPPTVGTTGGTCHGGGGGASLANGGNGGVITHSPLTNGYWETYSSATTGYLPGSSSPVKMTGATGGGGGGGGGTVVGGGGGAGGCWMTLWCFHFDTTTPIVLSSKGGNGATPVATGGVNQPGAGGGGGGGGGVVVIVTADVTPPFSSSSALTVCPGGVHGNGSAGTGTGQAGSDGGDGGVGIVRVYN